MKKTYSALRLSFTVPLILLLLAAAALLLITGCSSKSGSPSEGSPPSEVLVEKICGEEVADRAVTLKTEAWEALVSAPYAENLCKFSADGADSVSVAVDGVNYKVIFTAKNTNGTTSTEIAVKVLSNQTGMTVRSVCGKSTADAAVVLSSAEWEKLRSAENVADLCDFSVSLGASVSVSLDPEQKLLQFTAVAEDGTVEQTTVSVVVLSDDTSMTVKTIAGHAVDENRCTVPAETWLALAESENIAAAVDADLAENAQFTARFDREEGAILLQVTAEDGTERNFAIGLSVQNVFGKYYGGSLGTDDLFAWNNEEGAFVTQKSGASAAFYTEDGTAPHTDYALSFDVKLSDMASAGELALSAFSRENKQVRFVIRATSEKEICVFSDYRDDSSSYLNYTEHLSSFYYTHGTMRLGLVVCGEDVAMLLDGEIVYHRALEGLENSQPVISNSPYPMKAAISNIRCETDEQAVQELYSEVTANYYDALVGNTIGTTNNLSKCMQDLENGTVRVDQSNSTASPVMVSFYKNGNPVAGYSFAVTGTIHTLTVAGKSGHIGFMCYSDNSNWSRFTINRREGNNSCYYRTQNGGVGDPLNNTLCTSQTALTDSYDWTADFAFIYDSGTVLLFVENKLMCKYETNWGYANAIMEVIQNVDITYSDLDSTTDPLKVEQIRKQFESAEAAADPFAENDVFTENSGLSFVKYGETYQAAALKDGNSPLQSNDFYFTARFGILDPQEWGQGEIKLLTQSGNGVRFVLEYLKGGTYQIFTEEIRGGATQNWHLIASNVNRELDLGVAVHAGKILFFIGDEIYFEYASQETFTISLGGQKCAVRVKNFALQTDADEVSAFVGALQEYVYRSPYESRAEAYAQQYAGAAAGQTLLVGSSTFDFWKPTRVDSNGNPVDGYLSDLAGLPDADGDGLPDVINVGIGGSTWRDWLSFYDRLVQPFAPARLILYCGANDVNTGSAADAYAYFEEFIRLVRRDFPDIEIYYINIMPSPTLYNNVLVWARAQELNGMIASYAETDDHFTVIDMFDELCQNGTPISSLWDADNTHLTSNGYRVFASILRRALGLSEPSAA